MTSSRHGCQHGRRCEPRTIGEAIYCCALHSRKDSASIAEEIGVRRGYLLDAANPDRDEVQFQARLLVPLMAATGNLEPLRYMAREMNCALAELPKVAQDHGEIRPKFLLVVSQIGECATAIEHGLADGSVTPEDAQRIGKELDDAIEALIAVKGLTQARQRVVA